MKNLLATVLLLLSVSSLPGQDLLSLEECYARAEESYPLFAGRDLVEISRSLAVRNASAAGLPQIAIGGQASYQSDVTRVPLDMPGVEPLSKDQYRVYAEVSQTLYHGGLTRHTTRTEDVSATVESAKLDVQLYKLRERIDELYFGILLLEAQQGLNRLMREDLVATLRSVEAGVRYGTALRSAADDLHAELLRIEQRAIELESTEGAYRELLGSFISRPLGPGTVLETPEMHVIDTTVRRPELTLFRAQRESVEANLALLAARKKPRLELFLQGGYGRPALNMLDNSFDFYYIGGVRVQWLLSGLYTFRREKEILDVRRRSLDVEEETFRFNTDLTRRQHAAGMQKLQRLLESDSKIIALRTRVLETATAQLEQGVIPASEYIRQANAADQARQNRALHEIQWLMAAAQDRFVTGH